jgi:hypothetical protein
VLLAFIVFAIISSSFDVRRLLRMERAPLQMHQAQQRRSSAPVLSTCMFVSVLGAGLFLGWAITTFSIASSRSSSIASTLSLSNKETVCNNPDYTKTTLKTVYDGVMASLLTDLGDDTKHELSEIIAVGPNQLYAISDSSWNIFKLSTALPHFSDSNKRIPPSWPVTSRGVGEESSYEAIVHDESSGSFLLVREAIASDTGKVGTYHAVVEEVAVDEQNGQYNLLRACTVEKIFEGDSKGIEGAALVYDADGSPYLLMICEGNHCAQSSKGKERGNGRVIVARRSINGDSCTYENIREIAVPPSANFEDYSAIEVREDTGHVIIVSQADSKLWIGKLSNFQAPSIIDAQQSMLEGGVVMDFPKNDDCETVYCNVEGVAWVPGVPNLIVAVSDKMKGKGRQEHRCLTKDQSVHVFSLPEKWEAHLEEVL